MGNNHPISLEQEFNLPVKSSTGPISSAKASGFNSIVVMKMVTWSRESHGLFDYENKNTSKKILHVMGTSSVFRTKFNEVV